MNENMHKLLILLGAIAVVLVLVILLFTKNSPFMKLMRKFLSDGEPDNSPQTPAKKKKSGSPQRRTNEPLIEMATLVRKCDDRLRIIESSGQVRFIDEYYELIFRTRKGNNLKIQCSREAYERIPFNQLGSLTYKNSQFIRFKFYDGIVNN